MRKAYQETLREKWSLGECLEIAIDTIPGIPTYVELECKNEAAIKKVAKLLELDYSKAEYGPYDKQFVDYYGVDKNNINKNMKYIDYGLGILNKSVFTNFQGRENFDLAMIYNQLSLDNHLNGYEVFTRFYEIGSQEGIKQTEIFLNEKLNELFKKTPD